MTVLSFIKENRVLVAGLTLPLLLIGILALAKALPASMVDPPQQRLVYMTKSWSGNGQITVKVGDDGALSSSYEPSKQPQYGMAEQFPKTILFLYDPKTNTVEDTSLTLDKDKKITSLGELENIKLSKQITSADGYVFEPYASRRHSLITDIFSYRSYNGGPVLTKNGRIVNIPHKNYYGQIEFLGWESK